MTNPDAISTPRSVLMATDILPQLKQWVLLSPPAVRIVVSTRVACNCESYTLSSKGRCPNLENIYCSVDIAIMMDFTRMAIPIANAQIYEQVLLSARVANRCRRLPTPDRLNSLATLFRLPPHLEHELTESQIADFTSPKTFQVPLRFKSSKKEKSNFPTSCKASFQW